MHAPAAYSGPSSKSGTVWSTRLEEFLSGRIGISQSLRLGVAVRVAVEVLLHQRSRFIHFSKISFHQRYCFTGNFFVMKNPLLFKRVQGGQLEKQLRSCGCVPGCNSNWFWIFASTHSNDTERLNWRGQLWIRNRRWAKLKGRLANQQSKENVERLETYHQLYGEASFRKYIIRSSYTVRPNTLLSRDMGV